MLVGYVRVSSGDEQSLLQHDALAKAGCKRIHVETGSGGRRKRPTLRTMLMDLQAGDVLCVWKLDRLGQSTKHLIETVELLSNKGVGLKSLTEGIDTTSSNGKQVFRIFNALAELEGLHTGGRPMASSNLETRKSKPSRILNEADIFLANKLLKSDNLTMAEVAVRLGVSVPVLQHHLQPLKSPT
jgi:DNA invertase Pin-like site-specific DNA recombinase